MFWWTILTTSVSASSPDDVSQWLLAQPTPPGQLTEMSRIGLSEDYTQHFTRWVRQQLAQHAAVAVSAFRDGNCDESSQLQVLSPGFPSLGTSAPIKHFEGSVFRLETTGCLAIADLSLAEQTYNSAAFRTTEMPNLADLRSQGDQLCLRSNRIPGVVSATDFCLTSSRYQDTGLTVTHNALSINNTDSGAAPVYYREEVIIFAQLSERVGLYRMIWTRGQEIGMAGKTILQRTASSSQSRVYRALEEWSQQ